MYEYDEPDKNKRRCSCGIVDNSVTYREMLGTYLCSHCYEVHEQLDVGYYD